MSKVLRFNLVIVNLVIVVALSLSSCVITTRTCKVKNSKEKWKHYNSIQFGGSNASAKKRR